MKPIKLNRMNENMEIERQELEGTPMRGKYGDNEYPMERIRNIANGLVYMISTLQEVEDYSGVPNEIIGAIRYAKKFDIDALIQYLNDEEILVDQEKLKRYFKYGAK